MALTIQFFDVGQGDGIFIDCDGYYILVDLGSTMSKSVTKADVAEYLINEVDGPNLKELDLLVLTHGDIDHYNMVIPLLDFYYNEKCSRLTIKETIIGGKEEDYGKFWTEFSNRPEYPKNKMFTFTDSYYEDEDGDPSYEFGKGKFYLLSANVGGKAANKKENENSIVLLIVYGNVKIILAADSTAYTERCIIQNFNLKFLKSNVLKVGHHGSLTSSTDSWIDIVQAKYAFISSDCRSNYNLPKSSIVDAYLKSGYLKRFEDHNYVEYSESEGDYKNRSTNKALFTSLIDLKQGAQHQVETDGDAIFVSRVPKFKGDK